MKIAVLFGGKSTEHDISCLSASFILKNLTKHQVFKIGITQQGDWFYTSATPEQIANGEWVNNPDNIAVGVDLNQKAFTYAGQIFVPDVVFPVLHGKNGEDGTIQGLLEIMRVPYVGCRVLGSAVCMDKAITKVLLKEAAIEQVPWIMVEKAECTDGVDSILSRIEQSLSYPVFVKPANAGSSIGITRCDDAQQVPEALKIAFEVDRRVVIEQGLEDILEVEIAVLGNDEVVTSTTGLIQPSNEFYDFEAKYVSEDSKLQIPSGVPEEPVIKKLAEEAYRACDCKGLARVDFMIDRKTRTVYLNEINTMPGFTAISMYPKLFENSGLESEQLVEKLISLALDFS